MEDTWKTTEFTVLLHRDYKDVFILGGTDDIQVRNEEHSSLTLASDRFIKNSSECHMTGMRAFLRVGVAGRQLHQHGHSGVITSRGSH